MSFNAMLQRLIKENMHGPLSTDDTSDLDGKDPRWSELFIHFFITNHDKEHDDLLFFVRADFSPDSITDSPIFVRRNTRPDVPVLEHAVCWKRTLFLNLIVHMSAVLTVAVCRKKDSLSVLDLSDAARILRNANKTNMVASTRIIKEVFASPYKTRMDVKHSTTNACSFPLIHYTVNDYTSKELHIKIKPDEYLCVELSIVVQQEVKESDSIDYLNETIERKVYLNDCSDADLSVTGKLIVDTTALDIPTSLNSPVDLLSAISTQEDTSPFPTPLHHDKIVLFKGAVQFAALLEVVQQKSSGYKGWTGSSEDTEFILMRGPDGKGQCQVSVNQSSTYGVIQRCASDCSIDSTNTFDKSFVTGLRNLGSVFGRREEPVRELECSMTYVNVSWQSIVM